MKLHRSAVALVAAAALTLGMPAAAHAAPTSGKTKAAAQQKAAKAKAEAARKKSELARKKKAEAARSRFAFPGTVTAVSATGLSITRKERSLTVVRSFVLAPNAAVQRDGVRIALADVRVGDKVVALGRRVEGRLVVDRMNVATAAVVAPAPVVSDTATVTIVI